MPRTQLAAVKAATAACAVRMAVQPGRVVARHGLTNVAQAYCHLIVVGGRESHFDTSVPAVLVPALEFAEIVELG
jgi:hypothetical protein